MQKIFVFFGMVASGKSTLAQGFAKRHSFPYYNTDLVRKELAGLKPTSKRPDGFNQGIYSAEFTRRTYQAMLEWAKRDFLAGQSGVVLDGSYLRRPERDRVRRAAADLGIGCTFIQCVCNEAEVRRRLEIRSQDPQAVSDGRWEIYQAQTKTSEPPDELSGAELILLKTEDSVEILLERLAAELNMRAE